MSYAPLCVSSVFVSKLINQLSGGLDAGGRSIEGYPPLALGCQSRLGGAEPMNETLCFLAGVVNPLFSLSHKQSIKHRSARAAIQFAAIMPLAMRFPHTTYAKSAVDFADAGRSELLRLRRKLDRGREFPDFVIANCGGRGLEAGKERDLKRKTGISAPEDGPGVAISSF